MHTISHARLFSKDLVPDLLEVVLPSHARFKLLVNLIHAKDHEGPHVSNSNIVLVSVDVHVKHTWEVPFKASVHRMPFLEATHPLVKSFKSLLTFVIGVDLLSGLEF